MVAPHSYPDPTTAAAMKPVDFQAPDITCLLGAYVTNTHGAEFYIVGLGVDLASHEILVELQSADNPDNTCRITWPYLADWGIQLRPRRYFPGC